VATLREEYLLRRIERRQAETLIQEAEARDAQDDGRRAQRALDDWYSSRVFGEESDGEPRKQAPSETGKDKRCPSGT
jgi:hypothetical protein